MIAGIVNGDFEPIIPLSIYSVTGQIYTQDVIVDTGFNGWLSLPPSIISQLGLIWKRRGRAILGDGSECIFNVYEAVVLWDGEILTEKLGLKPRPYRTAFYYLYSILA
jgi:predicted aspartyl protease